jgi:hypothetical protein
LEKGAEYVQVIRDMARYGPKEVKIEKYEILLDAAVDSASSPRAARLI